MRLLSIFLIYFLFSSHTQASCSYKENRATIERLKKYLNCTNGTNFNACSKANPAAWKNLSTRHGGPRAVGRKATALPSGGAPRRSVANEVRSLASQAAQGEVEGVATNAIKNTAQRGVNRTAITATDLASKRLGRGIAGKSVSVAAKGTRLVAAGGLTGGAWIVAEGVFGASGTACAMPVEKWVALNEHCKITPMITNSVFKAIQAGRIPRSEFKQYKKQVCSFYSQLENKLLGSKNISNLKCSSGRSSGRLHLSKSSKKGPYARSQYVFRKNGGQYAIMAGSFGARVNSDGTVVSVGGQSLKKFRAKKRGKQKLQAAITAFNSYKHCCEGSEGSKGSEQCKQAQSRNGIAMDRFEGLYNTSRESQQAHSTSSRGSGSNR